mmetsp:Transcript_4213/g.10522  ORF Transcript_4213/g.10522 Transcript_4213/m.10522 type:complete len:253 (-) Transcript_4213:345-1103(-)
MASSFLLQVAMRMLRVPKQLTVPVHLPLRASGLGEKLPDGPQRPLVLPERPQPVQLGVLHHHVGAWGHKLGIRAQLLEHGGPVMVAVHAHQHRPAVLLHGRLHRLDGRVIHGLGLVVVHPLPQRALVATGAVGALGGSALRLGVDGHVLGVAADDDTLPRLQVVAHDVGKQHGRPAHVGAYVHHDLGLDAPLQLLQAPRVCRVLHRLHAQPRGAQKQAVGFEDQVISKQDLVDIEPPGVHIHDIATMNINAC